MKVALITDKSGMEPYYAIDNKIYRYDNDKPYIHEQSLGNECIMGFWNIPVLFNGWFLNSQYIKPSEFPDIDFDLIFVSHQRANTNIPISFLRKKYPNAIISSITQETFTSRDVQFENFKECDIICGCYSDVDRYDDIMNKIDKQMHWIPEPFNVNYLHDKFYTGEKDLSIFSYRHHRPQRLGNTESFASYIGSKYNIPVVRKWTECVDNQWRDFLNMWSPCAYHFNLDPEPHPGDQAIQCAILGTINIGGNNDSHKILFPETYGNDMNILERRMEQYLTDETAYHHAISYAWNKVNEIYSFDAVRSKILNIIKEQR